MTSDRIISLTGRIDTVDESSAVLGREGGGGDTSGASGEPFSVATFAPNTNDIVEDSNVCSIKSSPQSKPDVLLEGWMLKLNRNSYWQDRYFVFKSDQSLSYWHKQKIEKEDINWKEKDNSHNDEATARTTTTKSKQPTAMFNVSRHAGCEIGELYVEQRNVHTMSASSSSSLGKESLYCINITWTEDAETVDIHSKSTTALNYSESFNNRETSDDISYQGGEGEGEILPSPIIGSYPNLSHRPEDYPYNHPNETFDASSVTSAGSTRRRSSFPRSSFLRRRKLKRGFSTSDVNMEFYSNDGQFQKYPHYDPPLSPKKRNSPNNLQLGPLSPRKSNNPNNLKFGKSPSRNKKFTNVLKIVSKNDNSNNNYDDDDLLLPIPKYYDDDELDLHNTCSMNSNNKNEQHVLREQEKLHHQYLNKQKKRRSVKAKRVVGATKVAMAAGAAVGVGVMTAGVGLVAGLVFLGGAAAIGGTAGVAEAGLKRTLKKKDSVTIATTSYAIATSWKSMLDACLEQESIKQSTWAQRFAADGGKTASALIPRDVITLKALSEYENDTAAANAKANNRFLKDHNFFAQDRTKWRPLEGGWVSFLGPGAQSLRIFKEEKIFEDDTEITTTAIDGSACTPLRSQLVLNAHPTEAFMCIMSYARIHQHQHQHSSFQNKDGAAGTARILSPNSGQTASYRLLERIDDQMDILHLVCRELYLFPTWTESRDFVVTRYWRYEPDGSYIICFESTEHPDCPPQPGFVRGTMHQVYTIAPSKSYCYRRKGPHMNECMLTAVVQVDPKGWIPTRKVSCLSNQTYADAFGVSALLQTLDIQDAIENDRFRNVSPDLQYPQPSTIDEKSGGITNCDTGVAFDSRYVNRELSHPKSLGSAHWSEPDPNSFVVRGPKYKDDGVKVNAGASIGQLIAYDAVRVDKPMLTGISMHPNERIQLALQREKEMQEKGQYSDVPPFTFIVNIVIPGTQCFHAVFYYAVDDMSTIDGSDDTPSSRLCQKFFFGDSDEFRDNTFKLIPRIIEGNFLVRKAVGSTPAIMGLKLKQYYVRTDRFMELILDCGSSQVAEGVLKLSLGYAKTLVVDMGFLLEAVEEEHLPERILGAVRVKYPSLGNDLRKVEEPP